MFTVMVSGETWHGVSRDQFARDNFVCLRTVDNWREKAKENGGFWLELHYVDGAYFSKRPSRQEQREPFIIGGEPTSGVYLNPKAKLPEYFKVVSGNPGCKELGYMPMSGKMWPVTQPIISGQVSVEKCKLVDY